MFVALKLLANIATKILLAVLWADGNNFWVISVCFDWGDYGGGGSGGVGDGESDGDSRDEGNGGQCVVGNGGAVDSPKRICKWRYRDCDDI